MLYSIAWKLLKKNQLNIYTTTITVHFKIHKSSFTLKKTIPSRFNINYISVENLFGRDLPLKSNFYEAIWASEKWKKSDFQGRASAPLDWEVPCSAGDNESNKSKFTLLIQISNWGVNVPTQSPEEEIIMYL